MKKKKKIYSLGIFFIYCLGYLHFRMNHTMIHTKTGSGDWNHHWVKPAEFVDGVVVALALLMTSNKEGSELKAAQDEVMGFVRKGERNQRVIGIFFYPLRVSESIFWYIVDPK